MGEATLSPGERSDASLQVLSTKTTLVRFNRAVVVDEQERGLASNAELLPHAAIGVGDVIEPIDTSLGHPVLKDGELFAASDADNGDVVGECLLNLCDRRGFSNTRRSPRRPKPEHNILTSKRTEVDLTTAHRRSHER